MNQKISKWKAPNMGVSVALGVVLGAALGAMLENTPVGIAIGHRCWRCQWRGLYEPTQLSRGA